MMELINYFLLFLTFIDTQRLTNNNAGNDTETEEYWDTRDILNINDLQIGQEDEDLQEAFSRYQVHTRAITWLEAVDLCWREGGHLATPSNDAEARILGRLLLAGRSNITNTEMKDAMHVGIYSTNCKWNTLEGKDLSYSKFISPVPRRCVGYSYSVICGAMIGNGRLLDLNCNDKLIYACDMYREEEENSTAIADDEYTSIIRNHRHKLHLNPLPWTAAQDACEEEGAILAPCLSRISTNILVDAIFNRSDLTSDIYKNGFYFGYNKMKTNWVDTRGSYCDQIWMSGSPSPNKTSNCATMLPSGHAIDVDCSESKAFLCEKTENTPEYVEVEGMGRYALHTDRKSWMDAVMKCHSENATLAVPDTKEEAEVLTNIFKNGLDDDSRYENCMVVGVHDLDADKKWRTVDGTRVLQSDFNEWDTNGYYYSRNYLCACLRNGKYATVGCLIKSMFICEKPL